jgi:hypothetical protein
MSESEGGNCRLRLFPVGREIRPASQPLLPVELLTEKTASKTTRGRKKIPKPPL